MKQRQIEALERSIIHWTEIVSICTENLEKDSFQRNNEVKTNAIYKVLDMAEDVPWSHCFLCEEFSRFYDLDDSKDCVDCPVTWFPQSEEGNIVEPVSCEHKSSPYWAFIESEETKEQLDAAKKVLQLLKDTLKELKK